MTGPDEPTTRKDFPGGFPETSATLFLRRDARGKKKSLFALHPQVAQLHAELAPLKRGALLNLYVSEQQYAYARTLSVRWCIVIINNEQEASRFEFEVHPIFCLTAPCWPTCWACAKDVTVRNGNLKVNLPERSATIVCAADENQTV